MKKIFLFSFVFTLFHISGASAVTYCVYNPDITQANCTSVDISGPVWSVNCNHLDKNFVVVGIGSCANQNGATTNKNDAKYCSCLMLSPKRGSKLSGIKTYANADECISNCATECRKAFINDTEKRRLLWI